MQLSIHSDYALPILMALAVAGKRLSVDDVSRQYGISRNHLAKVAQELQDVVVGDIVRRFERLDGFISCFASGGDCVVNGVCGLKPALSGALEAFLSHLDGYRLSDLTPNRKAFLARLTRAEAA